MLFHSARFLVFFPIAVLGYYVIPHRVRYLWLLVCSYFFYMCWNPAYALLMLFSTAVTYLSGIALFRMHKNTAGGGRSKQKLVIAVSFLLNLGILAFFKYGNFIIDNLNALLRGLGVAYQASKADVLLPVGISFYTFQALSYTMDVYRGEVAAETNPFRYALFVSFFPQLVAGPIERSKNLLGQLRERHRLSFDNLRSGFALMLWGYFLKLVIADRAAIFVDAVYAQYQVYTGWYLIVASVLFAVQIYCDFAGYSSIAMGAALMMGFRLTDNFEAPFLSRSVAEFWRRWHVSLSGWFRDYLYIPLGGNRKGKARKYANLMIVFIASGLWHGAQWTFVVWGALNGLYQIVGEMTAALRDRMRRALRLNGNSFSHKLFQTVFTFVLADIAFVFFRADSISAAVEILRSMAGAGNAWILFDDSLFALGLNWKQFMVMAGAIGVLLYADIQKRRGVCLRKALFRQELWFRWMALAGALVVILVFGVWGSGFDEAAFLYFQF